MESRIKLDYSDLSAAARRIGEVASQQETYAQSTDQLASGLSSLPGGNSSYTSTAASLAAQKARDLRTSADHYRQVKGNLETLSAHAKDADKAVRQRIARITKKNMEGLSFWDQVAVALASLYNNTIGKTAIGRALNQMAKILRGAHEVFTSAMQSIRNFFQYGVGKYIMDSLVDVAKIVIAIGTIVACVATLAAATALTGGAALVAIAGIVGAGITILQKGASIWANARAIATSSSDPGLAQYQGNVSDLQDFTKTMTTNKKAQDLAGGVDLTGSVANTIYAVGGLGSTTVEGAKDAFGKDVKTYRFDKKTLGTNMLKKVGLKEVDKKTATAATDTAKKALPTFTSRGKTYEFDWKDLYESVSGNDTYSGKGNAAGKFVDATKVASSHYEYLNDYYEDVRSASKAGSFAEGAGEFTWSRGKHLIKSAPGTKQASKVIGTTYDAKDVFHWDWSGVPLPASNPLK